jgi:hypothetical protein
VRRAYEGRGGPHGAGDGAARVRGPLGELVAPDETIT